MIIKPCKRINSVIILLLALFLIFFTPGIASDTQLELYISWKFALISDTQGANNSKSCINEDVIHAIAEDIVLENPDFVLVSGDLVNGWFRNGGTDYASQYANWKKAMSQVYNARIKIYPVRGNHDSGPERVALAPLPAHLEPPPDTTTRLKKAFRNAFDEPYIPKNGPADEEGLTYSLIHKNVFIIGLDQFTGGQHKVNQEWLNRQLSENTSPHIFVFGHEPAFETNHKDNLAFYPTERDLFWNSIGKAGARVYFCGHDHFYNRSIISDNKNNQIRQIITGTGGGNLRNWTGKYNDKRVKGEFHNSDYHGYILVTIEGAKATVSWKALIKRNPDNWQILDTYRYSFLFEK